MIRNLQNKIERVENYLQSHPQTALLSLKDFGELVQSTETSVWQWSRQHRVRVDRSEGARWSKILLQETLDLWKSMVDPRAQALRTEMFIPEREEPEQKAAETPTSLPIAHDDVRFRVIRDQAIREARESYRDAILDEADIAEKEGRVELQVMLLKEFVYAEEQFKVVFFKDVNRA